MVQWLRLCTSNAGAMGLIPSWGAKILHAMQYGQNKNKTENYITICKIDSQQEFAVWLRKLKQEFCINLEQWNGEGNEREVQKGICCFQHLLMICCCCYCC